MSVARELGESTVALQYSAWQKESGRSPHVAAVSSNVD